MTDTLTYTPPELADIPECTVLALDGAGAPVGAGFDAALAALKRDVPVEGTWWSGNDRLAFDLERPDGWHWTLAVPVSTALRLERRPAQRVAWLVHNGPYEDEGPALRALYAFVAEQGLEPAGPHTEIYLDDPSRTAPEALRTELRVPVK